MLHGVELGEVLPPGRGSPCWPAKHPLNLTTTRIALSNCLNFKVIIVVIAVRVNLDDRLLEFVGE
jgi:hypothetical protein